jgi:DNA-binding CsgD family transcriptional regulator
VSNALRKLQDGLWSDANDAADLASFRRAVLTRLEKLVGFDTAVVTPAPHALGYADTSDLVGVNYDPIIRKRFIDDRARYVRDLRPFLKAMADNRGLAISTQVYSCRDLERLSICVEIHTPAGTRCCLGAAVTFRGHSTCSLALNRRDPGRPFRDRDLDKVRALLPAIGVADAAMLARCAVEPPSAQTAPLVLPSAGVADVLTLRERQVASLVALGLRNKEIAGALGTSLETVRKQTISVYAKLGVSGRVQLAVRLSSDLTRSRG